MLVQSYPASYYSLRRHAKGYYYILRNQTLTNNKNDELKRGKQEIQRLKRALKGRSRRMRLQNVFWVLSYDSYRMDFDQRNRLRETSLMIAQVSRFHF